MHPTDKAARVAGAVYLSMAVTAPFSLIYIPRTLIVRADATATANNILAHETLFRLGIVADLITSVIFVFLVMALYRLLSGVNKKHAALMVECAEQHRGPNPLPWHRFPRGIRKTPAGRPGHAVPPPAWQGTRYQRDLLGPLAFPLRRAGDEIALPSAAPGRLADRQLLRLSGPQLYGLTVTAALRPCLSQRLSRAPRRDGDRAVASDQGRKGGPVARPSVLMER